MEIKRKLEKQYSYKTTLKNKEMLKETKKDIT